LKKLSLFILILLLPYQLTAGVYCLFIDKFPLQIQNKSKINTILADVPYPSIDIHNSQVSIFSGKFKSYDSAKKLLKLTRMHYRKAQVTSCDNTQRYYGKDLFKHTHQKQKKPTTKKRFYKKTSNYTPKKLDESSYYCIRVYDVPLKYKQKEQNKIKYILKRLPETKTIVKDKHFIIYSGQFSTHNGAKAVAKILKKEFRDISIETCYNTPKVVLPTIVKNTKATHDRLYTERYVIEEKKFNIFMLDNKGYIFKDTVLNRINSNIQGITEEDIKKGFNEENNDNYFNGLYFKSNIAYDVQNNDNAYDVRIEFDLFQQGYYENKKKYERNLLKRQLQFYEALKSIKVLKQEQELLKIRQYENSVISSGLLFKLKLRKSAVNKTKEKMRRGVLTQYQYDAYRLSIQQIEDELLLYSSLALSKIPHDLWVLLNDIENIQLLPDDKLINMLEQKSIDLKLAKTLQKQQVVYEEWSDKLRLNLYAGTRKMYLSQNQTLIGFEAKVPLTSYSQSKELNKIQDDIMTEQVQLQHLQSIEELQDVLAMFRYKQQKLKTYAFELSRIKRHLKDVEIINHSAFASYANISFDEKEKTIDKYLLKYLSVQKERLNTYKVLIKIMYLIQSNKLDEIFSKNHL